MQVIKQLEESRDQIANIFREKYNGRVKIIDSLSSKTFSFTGFNVHYDGNTQYVAVRMHNRHMYDNGQLMHFARNIPSDPYQAYFLSHIAAQLNENDLYQLRPDESISSRPSILMVSLTDLFKMPYDGFGLKSTFKNPQETGRRLLALDNLIDETLSTPRETILLPNQTSDVQKVKKYGTNR